MKTIQMPQIQLLEIVSNLDGIPPPLKTIKLVSQNEWLLI